MSIADLSSEAFVGLSTLACGGYIKMLRTSKLIHVSGWRKSKNGFVTPLFSLGDNPDLARPKFQAKDRDSPGMKRIVQALEHHGAMNYRQLAKLSGLSESTIKNVRYMTILAAQKRVHISNWIRNHSGAMTALNGDRSFIGQLGRL